MASPSAPLSALRAPMLVYPRRTLPRHGRQPDKHGEYAVPVVAKFFASMVLRCSAVPVMATCTITGGGFIDVDNSVTNNRNTTTPPARRSGSVRRDFAAPTSLSSAPPAGNTDCTSTRRTLRVCRGRNGAHGRAGVLDREFAVSYPSLTFTLRVQPQASFHPFLFVVFHLYIGHVLSTHV